MENKPAHANCEYFINVDGMPYCADCGLANILIQGVLERIFGKEFFKEDKE